MQVDHEPDEQIVVKEPGEVEMYSDLHLPPVTAQPITEEEDECEEDEAEYLEDVERNEDRAEDEEYKERGENRLVPRSSGASGEGVESSRDSGQRTQTPSMSGDQSSGVILPKEERESGYVDEIDKEKRDMKVMEQLADSACLEFGEFEYGPEPPTDEELEMAALIQRYVKGFMIRKAMIAHGAPAILDDYEIHASTQADFHQSFSSSRTPSPRSPNMNGPGSRTGTGRGGAIQPSDSTTSSQEGRPTQTDPATFSPKSMRSFATSMTFWGSQPTVMSFEEDRLIPLSPVAK